MRRRIPRYHQIAGSLRERILSGKFAPGDRLGNQRRLAEEFGVTLMTLRHALEVLEREGLITRRHGLGTFIASPSVDYDILQLRTLAGDLSAQGTDVVTRFVRSGFIAADRSVSQALGCAAGEKVLCLERVRLIARRPISFQMSYLPRAVGEEAARADLRVTPLRHVLSHKLGLDVRSASETVSAVPLARHAARELGCRAGMPAFRSDRVSVTADGSAVVYDRVFIPGDRFRITRQLHYDTASAPGPLRASAAGPA